MFAVLSAAKHYRGISGITELLLDWFAPCGDIIEVSMVFMSGNTKQHRAFAQDIMISAGVYCCLYLLPQRYALHATSAENDGAGAMALCASAAVNRPMLLYKA
jgi:hypothetical protein